MKKKPLTLEQAMRNVARDDEDYFRALFALFLPEQKNLSVEEIIRLLHEKLKDKEFAKRAKQTFDEFEAFCQRQREQQS